MGLNDQNPRDADITRHRIVVDFGKCVSVESWMARKSCSGLYERGRRATWSGDGRLGVGVPPGGEQAQQAGHRLAAAGTGAGLRGFGLRNFQRAHEQGAAGVKGDALAIFLRRGMTESIMPHRTQFTRQDMTQITFYKLRAVNRCGGRRERRVKWTD